MLSHLSFGTISLLTVLIVGSVMDTWYPVEGASMALSPAKDLQNRDLIREAR
jgi:hypothetical protein